MDKRFGRFAEGGGIEVWPELNVAGQPAGRPATTQEIGNRYFVVLPMTGNYQHVTDELKAIVNEQQTTAPPGTGGKKKGGSHGSNEQRDAEVGDNQESGE